MSESKYCCNCEYVQRVDSMYVFHDYYCSLMSDSRGNLKKVDATATCNHFSARINESNSGYTGGSSSSCFLTSACVDYLGKADDCEELTMLRAFRDDYMKKSEEGEKLVKEYYEVAPIIVEKINASGKKEEYYADIYKTIQKCIELINADKKEETQKEYVDMVIKYKTEFNL